MNPWMEIFGFWIGFFGVSIAVWQVYESWKAKKEAKLARAEAENERRAARSLRGEEVFAAIIELAKKIKSRGIPSAFLATDSRGGLLAKMICDQLVEEIPIFIGMAEDKSPIRKFLKSDSILRFCA